MAQFALELFALSIDFDRDYGIDHRTGWSVAWRGSYLSQLDPSLFRALLPLWRVVARLAMFPFMWSMVGLIDAAYAVMGQTNQGYNSPLFKLNQCVVRAYGWLYEALGYYDLPWDE